MFAIPEPELQVSFALTVAELRPTILMDALREDRSKVGYTEFWTVPNVDRFDLEMAKRESPTANRFYRIADLISADGPDYQDFRDRVTSLVGVPS